MDKWRGVLGVTLVLGLISSGFALDPILIGDFEDGISSDRYDNWLSDLDDTSVTLPAAAVTRGSWALELIDEDGGDGATFSFPFGEYGSTVEENTYYQALLDEGAVIAFDVTAFSSQVAEDWASIRLFWNSAGGWDQDYDQELSLEIDGQPHTYVFEMTEDAVTALEDSLEGWGYNLGIILSTGDGSTTIYVDNIWVFPDGVVDTYGPYSASVEQSFNAVDPNYVDFTLYWKAGQDPGGREPDPNVVYPVNPDIVDEYIFRTNNTEDPNLYYVGATGVDPGLYDPNSEYGPMVLAINSVYSWTVVEAMDGYEQTFTQGVSTLDDVDPNNITGPKWTFSTLSTIPVIDTQPVDARFIADDVSVSFTIEVTSNTTPMYQWFYSKDELIDAEDHKISSATSDTFTITSDNKTYQAYFYCRVANQATISGGGTAEDVYSDVVSLVVEREVAAYLFDGDLSDTSGEGNDGTGIGSPTFVTGADGVGSALSLDGSSQYVLIGSYDAEDPNIFNNDCFPRADLLARDGIGGGLDIGTIMCWIQLDATTADQVSPILYNANAGWPVTVFQFEVPTDSDATNTSLRTAIWGDDEGLAMIEVIPEWADPFNMAGDGQWHMLASTWDREAGTMKAYLDGNLLATWEAVASEFSAWDSEMTIGFNGDSYFGGLIDNLRVYNYEIPAEEIAQEYYDVMEQPGCINLYFSGSDFNADNTGSSYCRIDLADFAVFAENWLMDGFYPEL